MRSKKKSSVKTDKKKRESSNYMADLEIDAGMYDIMAFLIT